MRTITKLLEEKFGIKIYYRIINIIHDELLIEVEDNPESIKLMAWIFQIGHLFSKAILYKSLKIKSVPLTGLFLESVEVDNIWRKSFDDPGLTPSNKIANEPGKSYGYDYFADIREVLPGIDFDNLEFGLLENNFIKPKDDFSEILDLLSDDVMKPLLLEDLTFV
jgi:hypothetical protein